MSATCPSINLQANCITETTHRNHRLSLRPVPKLVFLSYVPQAVDPIAGIVAKEDGAVRSLNAVGWAP